MSVHDTQNPETREDSLNAAVDAVRAGDLIVLPTDTVYGIGADAFSPRAVEDLLDAKGRGRQNPPPVLIGDHAVLMALATDLPDYVEDLAEALWPGALTLILTAQPSLTWDLGETRGTVALRMPDDETALELLRRTGPLAVSSANRHGKPAAQSVLDAATQLGDTVAVYLDGGTVPLGESSTILDTTVTPAEIVREGAVSKEQIIEAVGDIFTAPPSSEEQSDATEHSDAAEESDTAEESSQARTDAEAVDGTDSADTADTADGADTADTADTADIADTADTAEAAPAADVADPAQNADPVQNADPAQDAEASGSTAEAPNVAENPATKDTAPAAGALELPSEAETQDTRPEGSGSTAG